jgi:hypothetical protein
MSTRRLPPPKSADYSVVLIFAAIFSLIVVVVGALIFFGVP